MLEDAAKFKGPLLNASIDDVGLKALRINDTETGLAADLGSQISKWLKMEADTFRGLSADKVLIKNQHTIMAVSFGTWDIWKLAEQDLAHSITLAERAIDELFIQLNKLGNAWWPADTKLVLLLPVDVTFFPAFRTRQMVVQKEAIAISELWHALIRRHAEDWQHGSLLLFDMNSLLIDQVRERQLQVGGLIERNETMSSGVAWQDVSKPCIDTASFDLKQTTCNQPERFLFW